MALVLEERRMGGLGFGLLVGPFAFFVGVGAVSDSAPHSSGSRARFRPNVGLEEGFVCVSMVDWALVVARRGMDKDEVQE